MKKHKLVVVGFLGDFTAYLDISEEEAKQRYIASNGEEFLKSVRVIEFDDEFWCYDAGESEE